MKKLMILMLAAALLLCGCGKQEETPAIEETEAPTVQLTEPAPTESATEETTESGEEPTESAVEITVEDQFSQVYDNPNAEGEFCVHIPKFIMGDNHELSVNGKIYNDHMRKIHENSQNGQTTVSAAYAMGEANGYASVITCFNHQDQEMVEYSIFHINTANGKEVPDNQILAAYGYTPDTFRVAARKAMEQLFVSINASMKETVGAETYRQTLSEHLSDENIAGARPYIDAAGQLCFVAKFYSFTDVGYAYTRICLEDPACYPAPQTIACSAHQ